MSSDVVEIIKSVVGELKEIARSESIVGKPITIGGKTVVPIVKISIGFGVGGGQGERDKGSTAMHLGGGGGGVSMEPAAFIIMDEDGISLLPAKRSSWEGVIESVPGIAKKILKLAEKTDDKAATPTGDDEP